MLELKEKYHISDGTKSNQVYNAIIRTMPGGNGFIDAMDRLHRSLMGNHRGDAMIQDVYDTLKGARDEICLHINPDYHKGIVGEQPYKI